jgi:hypothetical protein
MLNFGHLLKDDILPKYSIFKLYTYNKRKYEFTFDIICMYIRMYLDHIFIRSITITMDYHVVLISIEN